MGGVQGALTKFGLITCEGSGDVVGVLTLLVGGVAQAFHDDRVVDLRVQLVVEEVDGEGQEGKVKEEGRGRIKESAPWMVWSWLWLDSELEPNEVSGVITV